MLAPDLSALTLPTLVVFLALATLSMLAITVSIYKALQFRRLGVGQFGAADAILETWLSGDADGAISTAAGRQTVLSHVLQSVFSGLKAKPGTPTFAEELGRQSAMTQLATLTRRMRLLEIVVQGAPMLGLLGTVIGMIDAFSTLAAADGTVDPALLAGGIWTALTTTAAGLAIALVTYFMASWLESRIEEERQAMETLISAAIHGRVDYAMAA